MQPRGQQPSTTTIDLTRPPSTWTRAQRVDFAGQLHGRLGTAEVARRLGVARSTVRGYLSDPDGTRERARRARAPRGRCEQCSAATGPARGERKFSLCARCSPRSRAVWTIDSVLGAYEAWWLMSGQPPTSTDWSRTHAARRGGTSLERFLVGHWPTASVVVRLFGSWPRLRAAGAISHQARSSPEHVPAS